MRDITNSDITLDQIITIIQKVRVVGSDGSIIWFIPYTQYIFCDTQVMPLDCNSCDHREISSELHYKVCVDDITYWIPSYAVVIEGMLRTEEQQNFNKWWDNVIVNQPRDWKEQFFKCTGRVIGTGEVEHNGYDFWKTHIKTRTTEHKIPDEDTESNR